MRKLLVLVTFQFILAAISLTGWVLTAKDRNEARAEDADLKAKLAEQTTGQTDCLKENLNLIGWKVKAQIAILQAADYLNFCADHIPASKFPKRRRIDPDDAFTGSLPPQ